MSAAGRSSHLSNSEAEKLDKFIQETVDKADRFFKGLKGRGGRGENKSEEKYDDLQKLPIAHCTEPPSRELEEDLLETYREEVTAQIGGSYQSNFVQAANLRRVPSPEYLIKYDREGRPVYRAPSSQEAIAAPDSASSPAPAPAPPTQEEGTVEKKSETRLAPGSRKASTFQTENLKEGLTIEQYHEIRTEDEAPIAQPVSSLSRTRIFRTPSDYAAPELRWESRLGQTSQERESPPRRESSESLRRRIAAQRRQSPKRITCASELESDGTQQSASEAGSETRESGSASRKASQVKSEPGLVGQKSSCGSCKRAPPSEYQLEELRPEIKVSDYCFEVAASRRSSAQSTEGAAAKKPSDSETDKAKTTPSAESRPQGATPKGSEEGSKYATATTQLRSRKRSAERLPTPAKSTSSCLPSEYHDPHMRRERSKEYVPQSGAKEAATKGEGGERLLCRVEAEMVASDGGWAEWNVSGYDMNIRLTPDPKKGEAKRGGGTSIYLTPKDVWINEKKVWPKTN